MSGLFSLILAAVGFVAIVAAFVIHSLRSKTEPKAGKKRGKNKDRATIIRNATRRLAQNSRDVGALSELADALYKEEDFARAGKHYRSLIDLCASNSDLDEFLFSVRYAVSQLKLGDHEEAYKSLMVAKSMNGEDFDVNYNLGYLEYLRKEYDKAAALLGKARTLQPDHAPTVRYLGQSLYRAHRYGEAVNPLTHTLNGDPGDKEILYALGQTYYELGNSQQALKVFTHLRGDPKLGPKSCLYAGAINTKTRLYPNAIMDYEIGLRHEGAPVPVVLELKYRLAMVCLQEQKIDKSLELLKDIADVQPGYKDVKEQRARYQELANNNMLKIYMIAPNSEFVGLCRRIATTYFTEASSKPLDISIRKGEWVDVLCEVSHRRWEDQVLFRFIRDPGPVGDMVLRDLYARLRDIKAGRGFCITIGTFTEGATRFVEARLIDLVDKTQLMKVFQRLTG